MYQEQEDGGNGEVYLHALPTLIWNAGRIVISSMSEYTKFLPADRFLSAIFVVCAKLGKSASTSHTLLLFLSRLAHAKTAGFAVFARLSFS